MKGVRLLAALLVILACALPATAQSSDEAAKRRHFLPHIADGDGWRSLVQVTNVSQSASRCTLSLHGLSLDRFETSSDIRASGSNASFQLDGNGGYLVWGTRNVSRLAYGYGILDCSTPVVAQVVFISVDRSGMPTGMATVPSSQEGTVFQFPVLTPTATLGMAISNDSNADAYCRLDLEDRQRVNQGEATITVPSKTDLPIMLSDVIAIPNTFREGSLTITCNQTVAMVGLHFELRPDRTIITFTTQPATVLDTSPQTVGPPDVEDGRQAGDPMVFDGMEFVWVPPGEFQMGSTSRHAFSNEQPVTRVRLTRGFWMGKYEVTQAQWQSVMGSNPLGFRNCGGDCPVERVNWEDEQEFIGKLNARSGGRPFRLPTEAEWEYAARAGTTTDTYAGDITEPRGNDPVLNGIAWYRGNSGRRTHPVGQKEPNAWGLYDMLGNVWERVGDRYGSYPGGTVTDPTGPESGSFRVIRGGSWNNIAGGCRSAGRSGFSPGNRVDGLGFRLLREAGAGDDDDETGQGVLFSEDFESYAVGSRPPGYEFVWGMTGRGAGEQRVESDGGNQYLRMAGRARNEAILGRFFDFDLPSEVSVSWRMRVDNDINSYLFGDPQGLPVAVFGGFGIKNEEDYFGALMITKYESDRKVVVWCPSGSGSRPEVRLGVWSEYRWEIDFAASRYTAYKDGERFCSAPFPFGNLVSSAAIGFHSGDTVMRFDDIVIRGGSGSELEEEEEDDRQAGDPMVFDGMEFVWVPPGEFQMGSTSRHAFSNEQPVTRVRLTRGFWMGKYEVTQAQWQSVMGSNPSYFTNCGDCPVQNVSRSDAQEFIRRLNARPGGGKYRLPAEAEWEYAARAGTTTDTYAGEITQPSGDDPALNGIVWYARNSGDRPQSVGRKAPNGWGLYDMLGNVWESVADWYGSYPGGTVTDPAGPLSGRFRVARGGGWGSRARYCGAASRVWGSPGGGGSDLGFRLVRDE